MTFRYFVDQNDMSESATLTEAEAHHFLHVMRGKVDDQITLFDGRGNEFEAIVTSVTRRQVEVRIAGRRQTPADSEIDLHFAVSLPKGDRARWLVEKLTELGTASLTPLITERAGPQPSGKSLEKLRRYSIEACKQSGRSRLLDLGEPCEVDQLATWPDQSGSAGEPLRLVAHPNDAACAPGRLIDEAISSKRCVAVAIGPEGGFSEAEVDRLRAAGYQSISLGPRILRIETAAVALASYAALVSVGR